jgi:hypothetical protein
LRTSRNTVEKIQVSLKSDKNNGYFTRRAIHIYDILLNSSWKKRCREYENAYFMPKNILAETRAVYDNVEKYGRARQATDVIIQYGACALHAG